MARKTFKAAHLELRHNTYFAVLYVPKDVHHILGKTKFSRSTQTGDLKIAQRRADHFVIGWQAQISRARHETTDPVIAEAQDLLLNLRTSSAAYMVPEVIEERYTEIAGKDPLVADEFRRIAYGRNEVLSSLTDEWIRYERERGIEEKTIDQMKRDVEPLVKTFQTAAALAPDYVATWIDVVAADKNLSASSVTRIVGSCRNFFRYLQGLGEVSKSTPNPFQVPDGFKKSRKSNSKSKNRVVSYVPFTPAQVVVLHRAAIDKEDVQLADLIYIGAYCGARIEEICSIRCDEIYLDESYFNIADAKTDAGIRSVPIHSALKQKIAELVSTTTDGYLLSGLEFTKYGDRSNAIGKRFGRLKTKLGYQKRLHTFHSIRKTLVTLLENAGVPENLTADIVGHEKPTITYGLYSGGATITVMKTAIEKISYPF